MLPRIAIAGNPNAGKSCLFNSLTGTLQTVGNYPGVTVERKEGRLRAGGLEALCIDLPGTYSLTAYSREELVARQYIIEERPDLVLDVVDASNLERNLYLTVQLMEMGAPLMVALNMSDVARKRGITIDAERLSALLGVPVVPTVANRGDGTRRLVEACLEWLRKGEAPRPAQVSYGHEVDEEVEALAEVLREQLGETGRVSRRWLAVKLLERDEACMARLQTLGDEAQYAVLAALSTATQRIESHFGDDAATIIAERRYGYIAGAVKEALTLHGEARQTATDQIDALVCNRLLGPLILVGVVAMLFFCVFKVSDEWAWIPWFGGWQSPTGLMGWFFDVAARGVAGLEGPMPVLHSLLTDALIGGVGGVMGFVPLIFFMFLFIAFLEDSGYIARVAFIMDRLLRAFGLQGKSVLAMIVSGGLGAGGCAVPGVMATRTLREDKDRLVTMMVAPFMNCGAKLPVYAMLIAAFFAEHRTQMMLLLWALSWAVALGAAWALRRFVIRGEQMPFVMELPPYHVPNPRAVLMHTWERTWLYIKKAGTIILAISIVIWVLMFFPRLPDSEALGPGGAPLTGEVLRQKELAHSLAGRLGRGLEPVSQWAGFDWKTNIALIGGFAAKEVVVGTMGTIYAMGEVDPEASGLLSTKLARDPAWGPVQALALMVFVMLYSPCLATLAVIRRESGRWGWVFFASGYSTVLAFLLAVLVYQAGRLVVG